MTDKLPTVDWSKYGIAPENFEPSMENPVPRVVLDFEKHNSKDTRFIGHLDIPEIKGIDFSPLASVFTFEPTVVDYQTPMNNSGRAFINSRERGALHQRCIIPDLHYYELITQRDPEGGVAGMWKLTTYSGDYELQNQYNPWISANRAFDLYGGDMSSNPQIGNDGKSRIMLPPPITEETYRDLVNPYQNTKATPSFNNTQDRAVKNSIRRQEMYYREKWIKEYMLASFGEEELVVTNKDGSVEIKHVTAMENVRLVPVYANPAWRPSKQKDENGVAINASKKIEIPLWFIEDENKRAAVSNAYKIRNTAAVAPAAVSQESVEDMRARIAAEERAKIMKEMEVEKAQESAPEGYKKPISEMSEEEMKDLYKKLVGRKPSKRMKLENLIKKLEEKY